MVQVRLCAPHNTHSTRTELDVDERLRRVLPPRARLVYIVRVAHSLADVSAVIAGHCEAGGGGL